MVDAIQQRVGIQNGRQVAARRLDDFAVAEGNGLVEVNQRDGDVAPAAARGERAGVGLDQVGADFKPRLGNQAAEQQLIQLIQQLIVALEGMLGKPSSSIASSEPPASSTPATLPQNPTWAEAVKIMEEKLGQPKGWKKNKREVLLGTDSPLFDSKAWGKNTTKAMRKAYSSLLAGDISSAMSSWNKAAKTSSPVMLDLDGDGKLGTTGVSTAKDRSDGKVGKTVAFDIDGDGDLDDVEWMDGRGDGMLVDDGDGGATAAMNGDGRIDGSRLFGDQGGRYANGYDKLALRDTNHDGKLTGRELAGLKTWVDDGDAKLEAGELKTLAELGITEIGVEMHTEANARGEQLMRSGFVQNGQRKLTEDVWFARK